MPSLSPPGAKSYPIALNAQIAGFALVNVASSGPAKPTTADARPKPSAASLRVAIPESAEERAELARQQAMQATRAADAAAEPDTARSERKKKGVLQRAGRLLAKAGTTVGTKVLGIGASGAPTIKDVLQVGRPRQEGPPPPPSVKQERQIEQQREVIDGVRTAYHARAGRAALAEVESLHAHDEQASEQLVGGYVDRFAQLHGAYHDADHALQAAGALIQMQDAAWDGARKDRDMLADQHSRLAANLPQWRADHDTCGAALQEARQALEETRRKAGTLPGLVQELALARDKHKELQRWAWEIGEREQEVRARAAGLAGQSPQASLLAHDKLICRGELQASAAQQKQHQALVKEARQAVAQLSGEDSSDSLQARVVRLEQRTGQAAARLAEATRELARLDADRTLAEQQVQAFQHLAQIARRAHDAAQKNVETAGHALRQHQLALRGIESDIRPGLDIERSLATAREAQARLDRKQQDIQAQLRAIQNDASAAARASMQSMRGHPPGFAAATYAGAVLHDTLAALESRLLAIPQQRQSLAADEIFELAIRSAAHAAGGDPAVAAQALQGLGNLCLADLARTGPLHTPGDAGPPLALAQAVGSLPRGMEILNALVRPSQAPLAPERVRAVQTSLAAGAELMRIEPSDEAARRWLVGDN